MSDD
jgi:transcription initiation factor TFIIIB Brf1 subunit/transcription initiation factor TFIIB